jgi:nucleotide-binding universal stress UspA family protein
MFKHLLLPTDGSAESEEAIRKALLMAQQDKARVTGLYVIEPYSRVSYEVDLFAETFASYATNSERASRMIDRAHKYLDPIEKTAKELGVVADTRIASAEHPYEAIVNEAIEDDCDVIVMASHAWKRTRTALLGSETWKVLAHSKVPVLVMR